MGYSKGRTIKGSSAEKRATQHIPSHLDVKFAIVSKFQAIDSVVVICIVYNTKIGEGSE